MSPEQERDRDLGYPDLWLTSPEGKLMRVSNDAAMDWSPAWAPDGRTLYFCSDRGGSMNIWRLTIDPGNGRVVENPMSITAPTRFVNGIDIARNGAVLIFEALEERWSVMRADFDPEQGTTTSAPFPVLRSAPPLGASINISPDGEWVAFTSHGQQEDLFLIGIKGAGYRRVTEKVSPILRGPAWSPDGQRIAFYCNREPKNQLELWSIRPDGSGLHQLTKLGSTLWYPIWSPDGRALVAPDGRDVWVIDLSQPLNEAAATKLPRLGSDRTFIPLSWSPDGLQLAGHALHFGGRQIEGIILYTFGTKSYRQVSTAGISPTWLNDSRRLIFTLTEEATYDNSAGRRNLHILDTQTGKSRLAAPETMTTSGWKNVSLSRDNRTIVFAEATREGDVWLMKLE